MKQLETYIIEKLKISNSVQYDLGLDLFKNVKSEEDFNTKANKLLDTLLDISENVYDGPNTVISADNCKYIAMVMDKSIIIFVGDNSEDECFLVSYNTTLNSIMITRLNSNITKLFPYDYNQSNLYMFKFDSELDELLKYCEKHTD
jgi:hypothetical protein